MIIEVQIIVPVYGGVVEDIEVYQNPNLARSRRKALENQSAFNAEDDVIMQFDKEIEV